MAQRRTGYIYTAKLQKGLWSGVAKKTQKRNQAPQQIHLRPG